MKKDEIQKVERYMRGVFNNPSIGLRVRPKADDSVEVYIGEEFIGIVFKDEEDGETSYNFQMAILEEDLD